MSSITFTAGTVIPSTWSNDVNNLTYNVFSSGSSTLAAALRAGNGTQAAPSYSFSSAAGTGIYRTAGGLLAGSVLNNTGFQTNGNNFFVNSLYLDVTTQDVQLRRVADGVMTLTGAGANAEYRAISTGNKYASMSHNNTNMLLDTGVANGSVSIGATNAASVIVKGLSTTGLATIGAGITITGTTTPLGLVDISGASAGQIKFPATANPSADVNTLDDYEEGTWTPVLSFGGVSTGIVYNNQVGTYVKIGKLVNVYFSITLTSKGAAAGIAAIDTLPFTATMLGGSPGTLIWSTMTSSYVSMYCNVNNTTVSILGNTVAAISMGNALNTGFSNGSILIGAISYMTS